MKQFEEESQTSQRKFEKDVSQEVTTQKEKPYPSISTIPTVARDFFIQYELQILQNRLSGINVENQDKCEKFYDQRKQFRQVLESLLLDYQEKNLSKHQQLISFIKQFFNNKIHEEQINLAINQWQSMRLTSLQISQIFDHYKLDSLIQTPGFLNIIAKVIYYHQFHNQYEFYNSLILEVIEHQIEESNQQKGDSKGIESVFENIELIAINLIINKQNVQVIEKLMSFSQPWMKPLLNNKQIRDFFIARHFDVWLSKVSQDQKMELNDEINIFKAMRDQSQLGKINFIDEDFIGAIEYLKEMYCQSDNCKIKLTKMIKASAIINNFEQEAGNAMSVISSLKLIIRFQDFSNINLENSTMNNIQFISSNFDGSIMNNVSIVSAQFIYCSLQNVNWQNLESSSLNILKENQTLFTSIKSILVSMIVIKKKYLKIFNLCFYNLHTGKQIATLYKQSKNDYRKQSLKLSCLGQVIVFNDDTESIFWSIQSQKKIRVNRGVRGEGKNVLSRNCETLAQQHENYVSLWRIYNSKQKVQIQIKGIYEIKFSNNNQILALQGNGQSFWDCKNGQEIMTIQKKKETYKFSPDGLHYAICEYQVGLALGRIYDETYVKLLQGTDKNQILNIKFSPDGKILAFQDSNSIQLWNVYDQKILETFDYEFESQGQFSSIIKFSPDGQTFAFKHKDEIFLWFFNQGKQFARIEDFNVIKIRFSQNGQHLMLKNYKYSKLWNFKNQQKCLISSNNQLSLIPDRVSFSCRTLQICFVYGCNDRKSKAIKIKIFDDMNIVNEIDFDRNNQFTSFAISPDFLKIAFFNQETVCIQKIEGNQTYDFQKFEGAKWQRATNWEKQFKFSPDGEYLITFIQTRMSKKTDWWSLQVWKVQQDIQIFQIDVNNDPRQYVAESFEFSNDSQSLAIPYGRQIRILNLKTKEFNNLRFQEFYFPKTIAFSVEGNFLACDNYVNKDNGKFKIYIWKVNNDQVIKRLEAHYKNISKIIFLNEDIIASASQDSTIKIWNWLSEQQIQVLNLHKQEINHLSVSHDRSMMVSQDCKGTVNLWINIVTQNSNTQLFQEATTNTESQNHKITYFYVLHSVLSNPRFRSVNCSLNGSQFSSTEKFNLQNVFQGIENDINN